MELSSTFMRICSKFYEIIVKEGILELDEFIDICYKDYVLNMNNSWVHTEDNSKFIKDMIKADIIEKLDNYSFGTFSVVYNKEDNRFYKREKL